MIIKNTKWIALAGFLSILFGIILSKITNNITGGLVVILGILILVVSLFLFIIGLLKKSTTLNKINEKKIKEDRRIMIFLSIILLCGSIFIIKSVSGVFGVIMGFVSLVMLTESIKTKEQKEKDKEHKLLTNKPSEPTKQGVAILMVGFFVLIGVWVSNISSLPSATVASSYSIPCAYAQVAVKAQLKSPSTADFPVCNEKNLMRETGGKITVTSYVDSQNSFGAIMRSPFQVILHTTSDTTVAVDDVVFYER